MHHVYIQGQLNCAAYLAGILAGILDSAKFVSLSFSLAFQVNDDVMHHRFVMIAISFTALYVDNDDDDNDDNIFCCVVLCCAVLLFAVIYSVSSIGRKSDRAFGADARRNRQNGVPCQILC